MSGIICKTRSREKGSVSLKKVKENKTEIKELQHIYGNWIKFLTDKDTEYEITAQDCTITFAYLSECENILKNGICVLNTTDNFKAMNKEEFLNSLALRTESSIIFRRL